MFTADNIGEYARMFAAKNNISMSELANKAGFSQDVFSRKINGQSELKLAESVRLASVLEISIEELIKLVGCAC